MELKLLAAEVMPEQISIFFSLSVRKEKIKSLRSDQNPALLFWNLIILLRKPECFGFCTTS